jgi:hypothetical protein
MKFNPSFYKDAIYSLKVTLALMWLSLVGHHFSAFYLVHAEPHGLIYLQVGTVSWPPS